MEPPSADSDVISSDWKCVRCGYNLRGLSRTGRCPECNTPIPRSLRERYLGDNTAEWLRNVRDGAIVLSVCYAVEILRDGFLDIGAFFAISSGIRRGADSTGAHLTLYAIECIGVRLLVRPEPRSLDRRSVMLAVWARRLYLIGFLASACYRLLLFRYFIRDVWEAWVIGELLLFALAELLLYRHLRKLSLRIPDFSLAGRFSVLVWLMPVGTLLGTLLPEVLEDLGIWKPLTLHRLKTGRVRIRLDHAIVARVVTASAFRLVITAWAAIVIWKLAKALKGIMQAQIDQMAVAEK
jgi:hypothetical protein